MMNGRGTSLRRGTRGILPLAALLASAAWIPPDLARAGGAPQRSRETGPSIAGMTLAARGERLIVDQVLPGSPAALAGLLAGDVVLVVDETPLIDLQPLPPWEALGLIGRAGRPQVRLVIGRGAGTLTVQLPLSATVDDPADAAPAEPPIPGEAARPLTARTLDGTPITLADFRGRPVLIEFWASWCPPCRDQAVTLKRLSIEYGERLVIVGISLDTDAKSFEAFVYNQHLPGHQVMDGGWAGPIGSAYGIPKTGIPYAVLIDGDGRVAASGMSLKEQETTLARVVAAGPAGSRREGGP